LVLNCTLSGSGIIIAMLADWIELCALLSAHDAEFLVVGGQAVIAHGYPRLTKDIDLWVRPTIQNGSRVIDALAEFGSTADGLTPQQFENPRTLLVLGREPFRIDILTSIPGVSFEDAWPARIEVSLEGVKVPVIGKQHLIANKRAVGRLQDLADIEALEELDKG
jgi:predicted nucleotidyltransferase